MLREVSSSTVLTAAQLHTFEHKYCQVQEASQENDGLVGNQPIISPQGRPTPEPPGKEQGSPIRSRAKSEVSQFQSRLPDWWTVNEEDTQGLHSLKRAEDVRDNEDKRAWTQQAAVLQQKLNLLEKSCSLPPTDSRCYFGIAWSLAWCCMSCLNTLATWYYQRCWYACPSSMLKISTVLCTAETHQSSTKRGTCIFL